MPLDRDLVERLSRSRSEPAWLLEARLAALERYGGTPWPTGHEEEWRRFPLKDVPRAGALIPDGSWHGRVHQGDAPDAGRGDGVVFAHFAAAVRDHPDLVQAALAESAGVASHAAFREMARALFANGSTFVHVPRGVSVSEPLVARKHWPAGPEAAIFRTIVVAEERSRVTVVEDLSSDGGVDRLVVPLVEIHAGPGAEVRYVRIQRFAAGVWEIGSQLYVSGPDSRLDSYNVLLGASRSKVGLLSDIRGDGAEVKIYGVIAAGDEQRIDVNSLQRLDGRGSQSDLLYLSALYGAAKATYYGIVRVEPTSHATGSYQECRNLLLSDKAGAHPIPVLEILTNDVARCGHGATAGRVDEDEVFYLMSRGIPRRDAEQVLVRGSFSRVIDRIPDAGVRARVLEALAPRIGRVAEMDLAA